MSSREIYTSDHEKLSPRKKMVVGVGAVAIIFAALPYLDDHVQAQAEFGQQQVRDQLPQVEKTTAKLLETSYPEARLLASKVETSNCGKKYWLETVIGLRDCEVQAKGVYSVENPELFINHIDKAMATTGTGLVGKLPDSSMTTSNRPVEVKYVTGYESDAQNRTRSTWRGEVSCTPQAASGASVCKLVVKWDFDYTKPHDAESESEYPELK